MRALSFFALIACGGAEGHALVGIPLSGRFETDGVLLARVSVGSAKQSMSVIFDTGSSALSLRCNVNGQSSFDASNSRSAPCTSEELKSNLCDSCVNEQCKFSKHYSEGSSIEGHVVVDSASFAFEDGSSAVTGDVHIGCITSETGAFRFQQADGVLGLSQGKHSILSALLQQGTIERNAFALCSRSDGGYLALGSGLLGPTEDEAGPLGTGGHAQLYIGRMNGYYIVQAQKWALHRPGSSLDSVVWSSLSGYGRTLSPEREHMTEEQEEADGGPREAASEAQQAQQPLRLILDSGSTYSFFPKPVVDAITKAVVDMCSGSPSGAVGSPQCTVRLTPPTEWPEEQSLCVGLPAGRDWPSVSATLPTLLLSLEGGGRAWSISPPSLFYSNAYTKGLYCLGLYSSDDDAGGGRSVLGLNAWHGKAVTVDVSGSTVSWHASTCTAQAAGASGLVPISSQTYQEGIQQLESQAVSPRSGRAGGVPPAGGGGVSLAMFGLAFALFAVGSYIAGQKAYRAYLEQKGALYVPVGAQTGDRTGAVGSSAALSPRAPSASPAKARRGSADEETGDAFPLSTSLSAPAAGQGRGRGKGPGTQGRLPQEARDSLDAELEEAAGDFRSGPAEGRNTSGDADRGSSARNGVKTTRRAKRGGTRGGQSDSTARISLDVDAGDNASLGLGSTRSSSSDGDGEGRVGFRGTHMSGEAHGTTVNSSTSAVQGKRKD